ncbi:DUF4142 domain-containing protein [Pollutimonas subterranea]|nr:DUF4142 domain-containing protein [Pollutimonas subterranea]
MKRTIMAALVSGVLASPALSEQLVVPPTAGNANDEIQQQDNAQRMSPAAFITQATSGNMLEIQSSKLAMDRSKQDQVRQFAERMIKDHSGAAERMKSAAMGQNIPDDMSALHAKALEALRHADDKQFDAQYLRTQLQAHQDAVLLHEQYAATGEQESLKQYAEQMLPILREHLQSVEAIIKKVAPDQMVYFR